MKKMSNKPNSSNISSPYVGLMPFTEKEADYFFGRKSDIEVVATNLRATCLTVFYGASGVGKSSLLNAGVVPYLQRIATASILPDEPPEFILVVLRDWANNPLESLRLRLKEAVEKAVKEDKIPNLTMAQVDEIALANKQNNNLSEVLQNWTKLIKTNFLIILDQFEDFFLHPEYAIGQNSFGEEFPKVVNQRDLPINFMLSMRDDAIAKLDFFKGKVPNMMNNTLRLVHLDRAATEEAIRKPLEKYNEINKTNFTIQDDLVNNLLENLQVDKVKFETQGQATINQVESVADVNSNQNKGYQVETPYLQLVLVRLWNDENTQNNQALEIETLTDEAKLGGVQKIVETHLDDVMNQFNDIEKQLAAEFIHFTVTRSGTKIPSDVNDLAEWAELPDERKPDIKNILEKLSSGETRIFKKVINRRNSNNPFYEVSHDALGPAILSWRKRENDKTIREKAELAEKLRKEEEIKEIEKEKAEQAEQLVFEQGKNEIQERLFEVERRNRRIGRWLWCAIIAGIILLIGGYSYFSNLTLETKLKAEKDKKENEEKSKNEKEENEIRLAKQLKEYDDNYKSLINILLDIQSDNPDKVKEGLDLLTKKVEKDDLPKEYKTQFKAMLKSKKVASKDLAFQIEAIQLMLDLSEDAKIIVGSVPLVFIQIQNEGQRDNAKILQAAIKKTGYLAPGIENVGDKPKITQAELRYFRDKDFEAANSVLTFLKQKGINVDLKLVSGYEDSPLVRPSQLELWFPVDGIPNIAPVAK